MFTFKGVPPEKAIAFTEGSVLLTGCWPLPSTATRFDKLRFTVLRLFFIVNMSLLLTPLTYAIFVRPDPPEEIAKEVMLVTTFVQSITATAFYVHDHDLFQRLVEEMKIYCATASKSERRVLQKYVDAYSALYGVSAVWIYMTVTIMILGTFFTQDPFPIRAEYPFSLDSLLLRCFIFVQQCIVGLQNAAHLNLTVFSALLTFFAAARFEILTAELRNIDSIRSLAEGIKKYHDIRRYAEEVVRATKPQAVIAIVSAAQTTIFNAISILGNQPANEKIQYFLLVASAMFAAFIRALPSDRLMNASADVMYGLYESEWYEQADDLKKCVIIALSPQAPVILSVPCILSNLTLNYYCSFVSNVFSMFTVLRVVMMGED